MPRAQHWTQYLEGTKGVRGVAMGFSLKESDQYGEKATTRFGQMTLNFRKGGSRVAAVGKQIVEKNLVVEKSGEIHCRGAEGEGALKRGEDRRWCPYGGDGKKNKQKRKPNLSTRLIATWVQKKPSRGCRGRDIK